MSHRHLPPNILAPTIIAPVSLATPLPQGALPVTALAPGSLYTAMPSAQNAVRHPGGFMNFAFSKTISHSVGFPLA